MSEQSEPTDDLIDDLAEEEVEVDPAQPVKENAPVDLVRQTDEKGHAEP